jgi:hypothetical protein
LKNTKQKTLLKTLHLHFWQWLSLLDIGRTEPRLELGVVNQPAFSCFENPIKDKKILGKGMVLWLVHLDATLEDPGFIPTSACA